MHEAGFDVEMRPQLLSADALASAALIVTFSDAGSWRAPPGIPRESWDLPEPCNLQIKGLRDLRDRLRDRVWRLVAKQGWYKLQPGRGARFPEARR